MKPQQTCVCGHEKDMHKTTSLPNRKYCEDEACCCGNFTPKGKDSASNSEHTDGNAGGCAKISAPAPLKPFEIDEEKLAELLGKELYVQYSMGADDLRENAEELWIMSSNEAKQRWIIAAMDWLKEAIEYAKRK